MRKGNGWFIGVGIVIVLLIIGNLLYTCTRNNGKKYAQRYIDNSVNVKLHIPEEGTKYKSGSITTGAGFNFRMAINCDHCTFYEHNLKKNFCVYVIEPHKKYGWRQSNFVDADICDRPFILARVNKCELNSPKYGTKENPVPILSCDYRLNDYKDLYDEDEVEYAFSTPAYYRRAVELYLTYVMSEEEFKERFDQE